MYTFKRLSMGEFSKLEYESDFPSSIRTWLSQWYATFHVKQNNVVGFNQELYMVAAYKNGKIVSLLPLVCLQRRYFRLFSIRFLEFLGQQWSSFGNDLIVLEEMDTDFLLHLNKWLKENIHYHFLFLKYMPRESVFGMNYRFYKHGGAPAIEIQKYNNYKDYRQKRYSRNLKQNLRKALNKTQKNGILVEETIEEISEFNLQEIKRISETKLIDGKSFVYGDAEKEMFYRFVYRKFESNVIFIKFDGVAVSYRTNIFLNGNKYCVDAAYDRKFRKYNLGIWAVDVSVKDSFSKEIKLHSMGPGFDSYKFKFANSVTSYFMCVDWTFRFKSLLLMPFFYFLLSRKNNLVQRKLQSYGVEKEKVDVLKSYPVVE